MLLASGSRQQTGGAIKFTVLTLRIEPLTVQRKSGMACGLTPPFGVPPSGVSADGRAGPSKGGTPSVAVGFRFAFCRRTTIFSRHKSMPDLVQMCPCDDRRGFLKKFLPAAIGAVLTLTPVATGLRVFLDPLRRKSAAGGAVLVGTLEALPADGVPRKFTVIADHVDAWNKFSHVPVGAVYVRRTGDKTVEALNVVCPHAGGFVDYTPSQNCFICPLHNSKFGLDGKISDPRSPSARAMDSLEVEIRNGHEVWVKFQNFEAGKAEKIPVS